MIDNFYIIGVSEAPQEAPVIAEVVPDPDNAYPNYEYVEQMELTRVTTLSDNLDPVTGPAGAVVDTTPSECWTPVIGQKDQLFTFEVRPIMA